MGRSVSTPSGAIVVAFSDWQGGAEDDDDDTYEPDFDQVIEDLQEYAPTLWPSLSKCDRWAGHEDHTLLENGLIEIGLSEYCGLAAYWIRPRDRLDDNLIPLAGRFARQIEAKFVAAFGNLRHIGTASNGEAFFQKVA